MEPSHWLKLGAILALLLGSLYVLAPTVVEVVEGTESGLVGAAPTSAPSASAQLDVRLDAKGDPAALADALRARLAAAGTPVDRVKSEGTVVSVALRAGGRPEAVLALAAAPGAVQLHPIPDVDPAGAAPADGVSPTPAGLMARAAAVAGLSPEGFDASVRRAVGGAAPAGRFDVSASASAGVITITGDAPDLVGALVSVDGVVVGAAWPGDAGWSSELMVPTAERAALMPILASAPLPGTLSPPAAVEVAEGANDGPAVRNDYIPDWVEGLFADTALNRGLDLQGGVDLTLYVGLDEAVRSRVGRDAGQVERDAAESGLDIKAVRRERADPIILVETGSELVALQAWFAKELPDYAYRDTTTGRAGETLHGFELREEAVEDIQEQATDQVLETLRERIDETGVKEPSIVRKGGGRINVQLPGKVDLGAALRALGTTAVLEFMLVDEEFDQAQLDRMFRAAETELPPDQFADDQLVNEWLHDTGRLADDRVVLWEYEEREGELVRAFPVPLKASVLLTGNDVNGAGVAWDQNQRPMVILEFKPQGSKTFCDLTSENVGKRFAIVLDGKVRSAPNIRDRICGGRASIEMGSAANALEDANTLALVLRTGSLTAPVIVGEIRTVGATLGGDAIRGGLTGMGIGALLVLVFMAIWYRSAGMIANIALVLNVLLVLAVMALFGATLTLPGIAGLALTIGMAVDANIIVYERIREEQQVGQHIRKAVEAGFEKAFSAIIDGNLTTAVAGVVLYSYGTGPIKGFAVTLLIGIGCTLVTALFVSRAILEVVTRSSTSRFRV